MKKIITIAALATVIGLTGFYSASASMGQGGMGGPGMGMHHMVAGMDDATKVKFKAFLQDTEDTRRSIAIKHAEKRALMASENPDAGKIGVITGELFDLRKTMHAKAEAAGLEGVIGKGQGCGNLDNKGSNRCGKGMKGGQRPCNK